MFPDSEAGVGRDPSGSMSSSVRVSPRDRLRPATEPEPGVVGMDALGVGANGLAVKLGSGSLALACWSL
jgi:hypothetical protein